MHGITLTAGIGGNKVKIPTYNNCQTSFETIGCSLKQQVISKANNWSDVGKSADLEGVLRRRALDLLRTISIAKKDEYSKLSAALERHFGEWHQQQLFRAQLNICKQKVDENLQDFVAEVKRLMQMAYPTAPAKNGNQEVYRRRASRT